MNAPSTLAKSAVRQVKSGIVSPTLEPAVRAERALNERRFEDAAKNIESIPQDSPIGRYWRSLLVSSGHLLRHELADAESRAWQAVGNAAVLSLLGGLGFDESIDRLIARALNQLGVILRRQERAGEAIELHRLALRLRIDHGSIEEQWDTSIEFALDFELIGTLEDAIGSMREALALASRSTEHPEAKQAIASDHLTRLLTRADRHEEAVDAARSAKRHWFADVPGSVSVPKADVCLAGVIITAEVARRESGEECHVAALEEAEALLTSAAESLTAFGSAFGPDACWACAQRDFVRRLREDVA